MLFRTFATILFSAIVMLGPARAATMNITPFPVGDFGQVPIGTTATLTFNVTFNTVANETFVDFSLGIPQNFFPFSGGTDNCISFAPCNFSISYLATALVTDTKVFEVFLNYTFFDLALRTSNAVLVTAQGIPAPPVSEVPLPTALPLFATGLGALGLLCWRKKRKQAA
jgi:hypothetical protein